jgi:hypothetical protein
MRDPTKLRLTDESAAEYDEVSDYRRSVRRLVLQAPNFNVRQVGQYGFVDGDGGAMCSASSKSRRAALIVQA